MHDEHSPNIFGVTVKFTPDGHRSPGESANGGRGYLLPAMT